MAVQNENKALVYIRNVTPLKLFSEEKYQKMIFYTVEQLESKRNCYTLSVSIG